MHHTITTKNISHKYCFGHATQLLSNFQNPPTDQRSHRLSAHNASGALLHTWLSNEVKPFI